MGEAAKKPVLDEADRYRSTLKMFVEHVERLRDAQKDHEEHQFIHSYDKAKMFERETDLLVADLKEMLSK